MHGVTVTACGRHLGWGSVLAVRRLKLNYAWSLLCVEFHESKYTVSELLRCKFLFHISTSFVHTISGPTTWRRDDMLTSMTSLEPRMYNSQLD